MKWISIQKPADLLPITQEVLRPVSIHHQRRVMPADPTMTTSLVNTDTVHKPRTTRHLTL